MQSRGMESTELRNLRNRLNLTQKGLAAEVGVEPNTVARWERGEMQIPVPVAKLVKLLVRNDATTSILRRGESPNLDPHYDDIVSKLNGHLDPEKFERCAVDLLRPLYPKLVWIKGGSDGGFDGAIPTTEGRMPLIATTGRNVKRNLLDSLNRAIRRGGAPKMALFATSRRITPQTRARMIKEAHDLGVKLHDPYDQEWFACALHGHSDWCKRLLNLSGRPSVLSTIPSTRRPLIGDRVIGREAELERLRNTNEDMVLIGPPGSGKTFLLRALAVEQRAWFVLDWDDLSALSNAIRDLKSALGPHRRDCAPALIVDDAHIRPEFPGRLAHLRTQIDADFRIIASTWPGDADQVIDGLSIAEPQVVELVPIDADTMVEIIKAVGIHGPNPLIRNIVRQAQGQPGLAATLAHFCLQGNVSRAFSGEGFADQMLPHLKRLVGDSCSPLLGVFALGGDAGVTIDNAAALLNNTPITQLATTLSRLAAAGVLRQDHRRAISVWPESFRWVLVRDTFFSNGPGSLDYRTVRGMVENDASTLKALIGARSRGAQIPELEQLLEIASNHHLWCCYAEIGPVAVRHVLNGHPELLPRVSAPALRHLPSLTIPLLLSAAIGDERSLHPHPDHPLRKIEDWALHSAVDVEVMLRRREDLIRAAIAWWQEPKEAEIAVRAICIALAPGFDYLETDPGKGMTFLCTSGLLPPEVLSKLLDLEMWPSVFAKLQSHSEELPWVHFLDLLEKWLRPGRVRARDRALFRNFASVLLHDLAAISRDERGVQHRLFEISCRTDIKAQLTLDPEFEGFYPQRNRDPHEQQRLKAIDYARRCASAWVFCGPDQVAARTARLERDALVAGVAGVRSTWALASRLGDLVSDPAEWAETFVGHGLGADLVEPFAARAIKNEVGDWVELLAQCLQDKKYRAMAFRILITSQDPPEQLLKGALRLAPSLHMMIHECCLIGIPVSTMRLLLTGEEEVALSAAVGEWLADEKGSVRPTLRDVWKKAILNAKRTNTSDGEYWLGEILLSDLNLAVEWLCAQVAEEELLAHRIDALFEKIIPALTAEQRIFLLLRLRCGGIERLVRLLVADDVGVYEHLLCLEHLRTYHLAPLKGEVNATWAERVIAALGAGHSSEDIASVALDSLRYDGPAIQTDLNGFLSEEAMAPNATARSVWKAQFENLLSHPDLRVRQVAERSLEFARAEVDQSRGQLQHGSPGEA